MARGQPSGSARRSGQRGGDARLSRASVPDIASSITARDLVRIDNVGPVTAVRGLPAHCWTLSGNSFALLVRLDRRTGCEIVLECLASASEHNWCNVFLECDNALQLCSYQTKAGRHRLGALLPAMPGMTSVMLRYHIQETRELDKEAVWSGVSGRVGICIAGLKIVAAETTRLVPAGSAAA